MAASESTDALAVAKSFVCEAPNARAKYVMASVCWYALALGSSLAASAQARRSSAQRAGIAATANTPAAPGAAPLKTLGSNFDANAQRYPLRSYGFGLRLNFFNYAILRWDYAVPLDQPEGRRGFWTWSLWPSF